jgi:hypothetical protein
MIKATWAKRLPNVLSAMDKIEKVSKYSSTRQVIISEWERVKDDACPQTINKSFAD